VEGVRVEGERKFEPRVQACWPNLSQLICSNRPIKLVLFNVIFFLLSCFPAFLILNLIVIVELGMQEGRNFVTLQPNGRAGCTNGLPSPLTMNLARMNGLGSPFYISQLKCYGIS
jgi:hypothetical protein